jgi:hypothetical protein
MSELSITPPKKRGIIGRAFDATWNIGVKNLKRVGEAAKAPNRAGLAAVKSAYRGLQTGDVADALDSGVSAGFGSSVESAKNVLNPYRGATPTVTMPKPPSRGDAIRAQKLKETVQGPPKSAMNQPGSSPVSNPTTQSQTSSPSLGALVTANAKAGLPAARTADEVQRSNLGIPEVGPPKSAMNKPDGDVYSNEDMSKQGYTLIGSKGGQKKWSKGTAMDAANKTAADQTRANIISSPVFRGRADAPRPLETEMRMVNNRPTIMQTGGDTTPEFEKLKAAQMRNAAGTGTKEDDDLVATSVGGDVLGRQPGQIAKLRADEKAGKFQAGRRVRA